MRRSACAPRTSNALRDAVYRSMLQLEAGKAAGAPSLCRALQNAWFASQSVDPEDLLMEWLGKVTPLCLRMLADCARFETSQTTDQPGSRPRAAEPGKGRRIPMQVQVTYLDGVRFAIHAGHHTIVSDQPQDNGGNDTGMTPPELLLASLGSCAAFYALQYLRTRKLAETGIEVAVSAEKLKQPARLGRFTIDVACSTALTEEQTQGLLRSVHQCLVHNTLVSQPEVAIQLTSKEAAAYH